MRILLDECIDRRLGDLIEGHAVSTVAHVGWSGCKNGELLQLAANDFDVFVTVDRNLSYQQNLSSVQLAIIVLRADTNRLEDLQPLVPRLAQALSALAPGELIVIGG